MDRWTTGREMDFQNTGLTKHFYPEYVKNSSNSITQRKTTLLKNETKDLNGHLKKGDI